MIYIIGSGFSGLTTAYALLKKHKNITVISPSKFDKKNKNLTLIKYLYKLNGEIKFNKNSISDKINSFEKVKYKNCKFISSYQDGGLSNIWGGVLSNLKSYNLEKFPFKKKSICSFIKNYTKLEKIIFQKNFKKFNKEYKLNNNISFLNFNKYNANTENLKKYLVKRGVKFKYGLYLKKIFYKKSEILFQDLNSDNEIKIKFKKLYLAAGPINTAKILLNSFKKYKSIKIYETRHFFCLIKKKTHIKYTSYFKFKFKNLKFYTQLYNAKNTISLFLKNKIKNINFFRNYFIGQCYLETNRESYIKITKKSFSNFLIDGNKGNINNKKLKRILNLYNTQNSDIRFYNPILNKIGSSNHIGASFPMSKKKIKNSTKLNGELFDFKNIYLSDSSVLNNVDMQPITTFSLLNILRMNATK